MDSTRRFPGGAPSLVAALPRRDLVLISTCIVLVTALAWVYLIHLDRQMSASMAHDKMMAEMGMSEMGMMMDMPWTAADAVLTFAMWVVMMIGMMAGTAAPVLLLFAAGNTRRGERGASLAVLLFGLGYLAVWTGFSALATLAQWALHRAAMLSPAMAASSPKLAGVILIAAGAYQLTSWKSACLAHCRSPLGFLMTNWREGKLGALRMGSYHGVYCLGCCWALMCVLFAVGVMNLVWVALLTGFVLIEKIGPAGAVAARVAGAAMVVRGILWFAAIV
jgi:predicted metal-binding membrane protein